jgi:ParB-like chromosome segregation protein Spo0J
MKDRELVENLNRAGLEVAYEAAERLEEIIDAIAHHQEETPFDKATTADHCLWVQLDDTPLSAEEVSTLSHGILNSIITAHPDKIAEAAQATSCYTRSRINDPSAAARRKFIETLLSLPKE